MATCHYTVDLPVVNVTPENTASRSTQLSVVGETDSFDVTIASSLLYNQQQSSPLLNCLLQHLNRSGAYF